MMKKTITNKRVQWNRLLCTLAICINLFHATGVSAQGPEWLSTAVFYQIYPSSFQDSDGNGIGDIPGIISRLDYIKSLGINAIWLNPVFESGWFDGGYDIIDFYRIDPRFGTNSDLVELIEKAHSKGIKVCLDIVAGHTSNRCMWFKESACGDSNGRYSDYYIWTDDIPQEEKALIELRQKSDDPATNTIGRFVESKAPRARYYEKNYFECQPALNYGYAHPNPSHPWEQSINAPGPRAVRQELKNIMTFWLDKGVDGFRVDMASSLIKGDSGWKATQTLWREMRDWLDRQYPHTALIAEWGEPEWSIPAGFHVDFFMHYGLKGYPSLFFDPSTPFGNRNEFPYCYFDLNGKGDVSEFVTHYKKAWNATHLNGYIAIPTANHDFQRPHVGNRDSEEQLKVAMAFFFTMPGIPFLYYGDEIGMKYQVGLPSKEGSRERAGTRTPMQWDNSKNAGFSECPPDSLYLPIDTEDGLWTVKSQNQREESLLNWVRSLIKLRLCTPALSNAADWEYLSPSKQPYPMIYQRSKRVGDGKKEKVIVILNPSGRSVSTTLKEIAYHNLNPLLSTGHVKYIPKGKGTVVKLPPTSAIILYVND